MRRKLLFMLALLPVCAVAPTQTLPTKHYPKPVPPDIQGGPQVPGQMPPSSRPPSGQKAWAMWAGEPWPSGWNLRYVENNCRAAIINNPDAPAVSRIERIAEKLQAARSQAGERGLVYYAPIVNPQINAWARVGGPGIATVCVPTGIIGFLPDDDELEAVIAHETGHALDRDCFQYTMGQSVTLETARSCERRADEWGMQLLLNAGVSPYALAGAFGRLEVYSGDIKTNIFQRIEGLFSDHPITPDRMQDIRDELIEYNRTGRITLSPVMR